MLVPSRPLCFSETQSNKPAKGLIIPASWGTWVGVGFELGLPTRAHTQHTHAHVCPPAYMCMCVQEHTRTCVHAQTRLPCPPLGPASRTMTVTTCKAVHFSAGQAAGMGRHGPSWHSRRLPVLQPHPSHTCVTACEDTLHAPGRGAAVTTACGWATPSERQGNAKTKPAAETPPPSRFGRAPHRTGSASRIQCNPHPQTHE